MLAEREEIYFHTPARLAGAFPYKALVAGARVALPEDPPIRKRFHQHVLVHTTSGQGQIEVRGQRFVAQEGMSIWLDTSQAYEHRCAPDASAWRYLWMGIDGNGLDEVYALLNVPQSPLFEPADREATQATFQAVIGYLDERSPATDALVSAAIASLIANLCTPRLVGAAASDEPTLRDRITDVLAAVRKDLARAWTIDDLAALAHLSPSQLFRRFKDTIGTTPMDWLRHERINQAKRLLVEPGAKVSAVSAHCGYPDPYHFSRDFRRLTGYTPTKFRRDGGY